MINCIAKLYEYCIDYLIVTYYRYNKNIVLIIVLIYVVGYIQVYAILHNSHYPALAYKDFCGGGFANQILEDIAGTKFVEG